MKGPIVLVEALEAKGWPVGELAKRASLAAGVIEGIIGGDRRMTRAQAVAMSAPLGVNVETLYASGQAWREFMMDPPVEVGGWISTELRVALEQIGKPHPAKKRTTVLLMAAATAADRPLVQVFEDPRACNQRVWYQKWQHVPEIAEALRLAERDALAWRDSETVRIEAQARQQLRRALAEGALDGVAGLRKTAEHVRGRDGTDAAMKLVAMFEPERAVAADPKVEASIPVRVTEQADVVVKFEGLDGLSVETLRALADGAE